LSSGKNVDVGALCPVPHEWNGTELIENRILKKEPVKAVEETCWVR